MLIDKYTKKFSPWTFEGADINSSAVLRTTAKPLVLSVLTGTLATAFTVCLMGLSAWLIASAALQPPLYVLSLSILGVRCCGIMRAIFRYLERYLSHQTGFQLFTELQSFLLQRIVAALPFQARLREGDAFRLIAQAVDRLRDSFLRFFLPPVTSALITLLAACWLSLYSGLLALVLLLSWPIFALLLPCLYLRACRKIQAQAFDLHQDIMDMYRGNLEMQAYGYQPQRLAFTDASIQAYQARQTEIFRLQCRLNALSELMAGLLGLLCFGILITLTNEHALTAVMAITLLLTLQALLDMLQPLPGLAEHLQIAQEQLQNLTPFIRENKKGLVHANKAYELSNLNPITEQKLPTVSRSRDIYTVNDTTNQELPPSNKSGELSIENAKEHYNKPPDAYTSNLYPKVNDTPNNDLYQLKAQSPVLQVTDLAFGYEKPLLQGLSFIINQGEKTLITGASGCGKSTMFYVLTGLLSPMTGRIQLQGRPLDSLSQAEIASACGISLQEHHIFQLSIRENFQMLYPEITDEEILQALEKTKLAALALAHGLDTPLQTAATNLSGGQRQRLRLAMAIARPKPLLLLDEPTASLDIEAAGEIMANITGSHQSHSRQHQVHGNTNNSTMSSTTEKRQPLRQHESNQEIIINSTDDWSKTAILAASHDLNLLPYFDNIIILEGNTIAEQGNIEILLQDEHSRLSQLAKYQNLM